MTEDEAFAADDTTLAAWLRDTAGWITTTVRGQVMTFDPSGGLWHDDAQLAAVARTRRARRMVLGDERDTHALNHDEHAHGTNRGDRP